MADQRTGGQKPGANDPADPRRQQPTQPNPTAGERPAGRSDKPAGEAKDDPSVAPESGDRKATGND